jgi:TolB-like protein/Flp pilus assembly protein TadD
LSLALAAAIAWNIWKSEFIRHPVTNGIAVLPFENLSRDPDNAYFAVGIQEQILTRLASIAGLKVISRTSTQHYQNKPRNLGEIAKQLGVVNILEGSVQKAADQVRVNVQLVNAQTDSHLWADTYDRKLTDIFSVESEIAKRIAESLRARLTGREEQALALEPTNNPDAYDAYLRGVSFTARTTNFKLSPDFARKAIGFFDRAVQLDPNFALAWARLSIANGLLYSIGLDPSSVAAGDAAKRALENSLKLEPNSPETLLALGHYQYRVLRDYAAAKNTLNRVGKMLPGNTEIPLVLGAVTGREGKWDESIAYREQALALDPRNVGLLLTVAHNYACLRRFPAALKLFDRALDITSNDLDILALKARIYQAQGNLQQAARCISEINEQTPDEGTFDTKINQLRLERNYSEAVRLLQARLAQFHFDAEYDRATNQLSLTTIQRLAGDTAGAKLTAEQARNTFERLYINRPDDFPLALLVSQAYALTGQKDSALREAQRAITLKPRAKDPVDGPHAEENLAFIQTIFGENKPAISILTQLLQTPYGGWFYFAPFTPQLLRLDPIWDPLRSDPAFQKLCEEKQK